jgi:DNA-binding NtrC family response regulator
MPATVVLVHEDRQYVSEASGALREAGFEVAATSNAFVALNTVQNAPRAKLLVTPLRMPNGMPNGVSLALMARSRCPGIKVLFLADPELQQHATGLGALLRGEKPSISDLVTEVARIASANKWT